MSTTTSTITLNFFGEKVSIPSPQSLDSLRNSISALFFFSPEDAKEILITYDDNGDKLIIENDEDLKAFLESKVKTIDLDISQTSKIYKKSVETIKEENEKDKLNLENLLKRQDELDKMKETEFSQEREEIKKIHEQIIGLRKQKCEIRKKIMQGMQKINHEKRENHKQIVELQKKLGLPISKPKHCCNKEKMEKMHKHMKRAHCHRMMNPFGFPFGLYPPMPYRFPFKPFPPQKKDDKKNKTIDDWGKFLLDKTQEITANLADKFKDFPIFNIPINEKKEEKKEQKEIHNFVRCDGCGMFPLVGKRFKCKVCPNFDFCEKCLEKNKESHQHEFQNIPPMNRPRHFHHFHPHMNKFKKFEKKIEKSKTMGNIFEKEKEEKNEIKTESSEKSESNNPAGKLIHYGIACDGCKTFPIVGIRYKCAVCDDFDFCEECEKKKGEEHNHPFLKIYEPKMTPISFKCFGQK